MAVIQNFEDFLLNEPAQIDIPYLIMALILSALFSFILSKLYVKYGTSVSNRTKFLLIKKSFI